MWFVQTHVIRKFGYFRISEIGNSFNCGTKLEIDFLGGTETPEPGFYGLLLAGLAGLCLARRRKMA